MNSALFSQILSNLYLLLFYFLKILTYSVILGGKSLGYDFVCTSGNSPLFLLGTQVFDHLLILSDCTMKVNYI